MPKSSVLLSTNLLELFAQSLTAAAPGTLRWVGVPMHRSTLPPLPRSRPTLLTRTHACLRLAPDSSPACPSTSISAHLTDAHQKFGHASTVDVFNPTPGGGPETNQSATLTIPGAASTLSPQPTPGTATAGNSTTFTITGNGASGTI